MSFNPNDKIEIGKGKRRHKDTPAPNFVNRNTSTSQRIRRNVEDYFSEILPTTVVGSPSRNYGNAKQNDNFESRGSVNDNSNSKNNNKDDKDRKNTFNVAGGFLGFGPQSKAPLDDILEIRNNVIKEESIDELTKKLEDVAMERSQQQTMKKDDPDEIRPLSGESSGTVIDLITNDLQQDSNKTPNVAKPIIPTIFLEDKEVDEDTFVQVNHNALKDDFNAKVNDEFILDMGDIEDELSPLIDTDSNDTILEEATKIEENTNANPENTENTEKQEDKEEEKELLVNNTNWNRPILTNPSIDLKQRILSLAQKGDWEACEVTLNMLEKETPKDDTTPMKDITDEVTGNTPLMYAAMENKLILVRKMIKLGCDVNAVNKEGYSALHLGSMYAREPLVSLLLSHQADPSITGGPRNQTAVHLVCSRSTSHSLKILRSLLSESPKDIRTKADQEGNIPLFAAIQSGNYPITEELLKHETEKQLLFQSKNSKDTALHLAARNQDNDMAKLFIKSGAEIDSQNSEGQTALHIASMNGDEYIIRTLYKVRANPSLIDSEDRTPMHLAAERGHTSTVEFLADKFKASVFDRTKDGSTLMHIAANNGHPDTAMILFKKGVPLLMPNKSGARGIHTAAMKGHIPVIKNLLKKGENVDAVTKENYTALHLAVESGQHEVVETLLGEGANVHIRGGPIGETALHIASRIEDFKGERCSKMLIKSGADINLTMSDGKSPLHISAETGTINVLRYLLSNGAEPLEQDNLGETALHKSSRNCHQLVVNELLNYLKNNPQKDFGSVKDFVNVANNVGESSLHLIVAKKQNMGRNVTFGKNSKNDQNLKIVQALMENGADVFMQTKQTQEIVFHYASKEGNVEIVKTIIQGLNPGQVQIAVNKQSSTGWTPLMIAAQNGHLEIVKVLLDNNARVDVFNQEGKSSLHLAAESGSEDVCEELLERKAYVNSKTKTGWTSLHFASMKGFTTLVESLIRKYKATVDSLTMKKQTPLHLAASAGKKAVVNILLDLGASLDATDDDGQKPIHMAAKSNRPEVVRHLLEQKPNSVFVVTKNGNTSAHIAAAQGSVLVIEELTRFNKKATISARNKITDSTPLHVATEGGHFDVVKKLLDDGALASDENKEGYTPIHIAAKFGYTDLITKFANAQVNLRQISRKTGLSALHIASFYGEEDTVRELLSHVPASIKSELPSSTVHTIAPELIGEYDLTPLHLAAYSGSEDVVRVLLNSSGVDVEEKSNPSGYIALHLASLKGHVGVVGILLSRSTSILEISDGNGLTSLHVAAKNGHYEMVQNLLGQGSDLSNKDKDGWTPLHCAANAGHLDVVKHLVDSGASTKAETTDGRTPLWFAAAESNLNVVFYLINQDHDTYGLLDDKKFVFNLMASGKKSHNAPTEEFILEAPAPVDVAAKISAIYRGLSIEEKDRANDLTEAANFSEEICNDLVGITAAQDTPGIVLESTDRRTIPFLDVLIENELKKVISNSAVQQYVGELWKGGLQTWPSYKLYLFYIAIIFFPPVWFVFSLPLDNKYNKTPTVRFIVQITSHIYFMIIQIFVGCLPLYPIYRESMLPYWIEWLLFLWLAGEILVQFTEKQEKKSFVKIGKIVLVSAAVLIHIITPIFFDQRNWFKNIYVRDQFIGVAFLLCCAQFLDFMRLSSLFGPLALIIGKQIEDTLKFLVLLALFLFGFTMLTMALNEPLVFDDTEDDALNSFSKTSRKDLEGGGANLQKEANAYDMLKLLFFALFGLTKAEDTLLTRKREGWVLEWATIIFSVYLLITAIVLINLLIAMMSDTYQRIQKESDIEWKKGRTTLIRNMHRATASPPPINLITTGSLYMYHKYKDRQMKNDHYRKMKKDALAGLARKKRKGKISPGLETQRSDLFSAIESGTSATGSASNLRENRQFLENAIKWNPIVKKYRSLRGESPE